MWCGRKTVFHEVKQNTDNDEAKNIKKDGKSCSRFIYACIGMWCLGQTAMSIAYTINKCDVFAGNYNAGSRAQPQLPTTWPSDDSVAKKIFSEVYGDLPNGRNVTRYTLTNEHMKLAVLNYGGIISQIMMPDKNGRFHDIVLGYDNLEDYVRDPHLLGAIVGRYANLIADNTFRLDGDTYSLDVDRNTSGFSKQLWNADIRGDTLKLTYVSLDGEDGFPGNVNVTVTYELTSKNELIITYFAATNKPTVINLTNRSFFNLAGTAAESLEDHSVRTDADFYTPLDNQLTPTGDTESVDGTMFDVRANTQLGPRLPQVPGGRGFDTNFALKRSGWNKHMASIRHSKSGRTLDVYSTEPGLQFNTGYHLQGIAGKRGVVHKQYGGCSLEPQHCPNSPNEPRFPTTIVRPNKPYTQTTKYVFDVKT